MAVLEQEIAELNGRLMSLAERHSGLLGEYFDAKSDALEPVRASGMAAIGDGLQVPPALLPVTARHRLARLHQALREALAEIYGRRMGGCWERLADELRLDDATRRYLDFGRRPRWLTLGRPDLVVAGDDFVITEPNAGSSFGAMPGTDILGRLFEAAPVIGGFLSAAGARRPDAMGAVADLLRGRLQAAGHRAGTLTAVTELREDFDGPGHQHCEMFAAGLRRHGMHAVACPVEDLDCGSSAVTLRGERCGLIYRKWGEQPDPVGQYPVLEPFLRAARAQQVLLVDDLGDQIAANKSILAVLSEELGSGGMPSHLAGVLAGFVPWTRLVADGPVIISADKTDLLPWCLGHQDQLVLKPGAGFQARGVVLGCEVTAAQWAGALDGALASPDAWLVQRLVRTSPVQISVSRGGELARHDSYVDYGYFAAGDVVPAAAIRRNPKLGLATRVVNFSLGGYSPAFFV
jgi:hypothetical protein